jgi:NAD(P)-dependent dehydrogenase (short-subunit alcohol dehydrogenase family)
MFIEELFSLKGKVAIVSGALGLLGKAHCLALAQAGAKVVALDLDAESLNQWVSQLPNGPHLGLRVDITQKSELVECREKVLEQFSSIDILVNNAAINDSFENPMLAAELSRFENYPLETWKRALEVNITGVFLSCQVLGSFMAEAKKRKYHQRSFHLRYRGARSVDLSK